MTSSSLSDCGSPGSVHDAVKLFQSWLDKKIQQSLNTVRPKHLDLFVNNVLSITTKEETTTLKYKP